jgi:RNA polymerase sigma-70 factor (ECF subfamily)
MSDPADRLYERVLVLRCQTGDEAAFAELVQRYTPRLRYFIRKMLADAHGAEDVLQEVWIDVFRGVAGLNELAAFPAWVYRIARDRVARHLRKRAWPRSTRAEAALADEVPDDTFSAEDAERVHASLDELPPEPREILVLRFLEEMTYDDIARVVGCPVGTVRSRLHYAKRALREILERKDKHE